MRNAQVQILSGAATANVTGSAIDVNQIVSASFQIVCGDAAVAGTVKLQVSNDLVSNGGNRAIFVPTNWSDIPSASSTVTAGVGAPIVIANMCFSYIRAVFTRTGGATTIVVNMNSLSI